MAFNLGFAGSADRGHFTIDRDEAKNFMEAIGYAVTPWNDLRTGVDALLNFFHPTDNQRADQALEYYREREWRIACGFRLRGSDGQPDIDLLRVLTQEERQRLLDIDPEFFSRTMPTGLGETDALDLALVLPGLHHERIIQMVRRVIVPASAVKDAINLLSALDHPPPVIPLEEI